MDVNFHSVRLSEPIQPHQRGNVAEIILDNFKLVDKDIIIITSKIVAILEGRVVRLEDVKVRDRARKLAKIYGLNPKTVELVLREGNILLLMPLHKFMRNKASQDNLKSLTNPEVPEQELMRLYDNFKYIMITHKHGLFTDTAGIDYSNMPEGYACLLPQNPMESAAKIRREIKQKASLNVAVIITDTLGASQGLKGSWDLPIGYSGIDPVERNVGGKDVFGKYSTGGRGNYVLPLSAMAGLVQGNSNECTPISVARGLNYVSLDDDGMGYSDIKLNWRVPFHATIQTLLSTVWFHVIFTFIRLTSISDRRKLRVSSTDQDKFFK